MTDNEELFFDLAENKRIVVFGAGQNGTDFIKKYNHIVVTDYLVDNNAELWDREVGGITVKSPLQLKKDFDENGDILVLIAVGRYFEVCLQFLKQGLQARIAYVDGMFIGLSETITSRMEPRYFVNVLLRIETTNRCNFNCSFCSHGQLTRPVGDMDDNLYRKVISEAAELGFRKLDLRNFGEPLLDQKLEEHIAFAKECGFTNIFIYTNALLLTRERYKSLSGSGLKTLIISLSPKREFELTRKGVPYERIFDNIVQCADEYNRRQSENACSTTIEIHIVAPASTDSECRETELTLRDIGIENIVRTHIHNWADSNNYPSPEALGPCHRVFDSLTVLQDGKVALCCIDYDGKYILGDLNEDSLSDVINSKKYRAMRNAQLQLNVPSICRSCTNFR